MVVAVYTDPAGAARAARDPTVHFRCSDATPSTCRALVSDAPGVHRARKN
jgi:hypothetical protein